MVSSEMSRSTDGGMSAGLALMWRVNSCWSTMPSPCCDLDGLADQVDRDLGRDHLVPPHDLEVDVGDHVPERVVLDVAGQGQVVVRPDLEGEQGVEPGLAGQGDLELAGHDGHRDGVGPVSVHHTGDLALGAQPSGRARSGGATGFSGERDFGHAGNSSGDAVNERLRAQGRAGGRRCRWPSPRPLLTAHHARRAGGGWATGGRAGRGTPARWSTWDAGSPGPSRSAVAPRGAPDPARTRARRRCPKVPVNRQFVTRPPGWSAMFEKVPGIRSRSGRNLPMGNCRGPGAGVVPPPSVRHQPAPGPGLNELRPLPPVHLSHPPGSLSPWP